MEWTNENMQDAYEKIRSKAMTDADFRKELIADPAKAIEKEMGIAVDPSYKIRIIEEDPAYQATFFLPAFSDEFSASELDGVAGGACAGDVCGAKGCAGQIAK